MYVGCGWLIDLLTGLVWARRFSCGDGDGYVKADVGGIKWWVSKRRGKGVKMGRKDMKGLSGLRGV